MRKIVVGYLCFFAVLFTLFFGGRFGWFSNTDSYNYSSEAGVQYPAKVSGKDFFVNQPDGWQQLFVAGVNIGASKPGYYPGDFGISKNDYLRWFQYIGEMNANTIRVYVLQMPEFYEAFEQYNKTAEKPLYLMHGVYLNENDVLEYQDAYAEGGLIRNTFVQDVKNIVDVVHGNAKIEKVTGHAGGIYTADISQYVIGWILGIEWEAGFVETTNANNPDVGDYDGSYLYSQDASPFEAMLAEAADTAIQHDMQGYNQQRPVAISNWVTSDPLEHPGEPMPEKEDAVSIDAEKIIAKEEFEAGFFASYHVYPYYPDFFNYDDKYLQDDPPNSYRAYLKELNSYHTMPVLISEVGIPASRGITHENIHSGFNQGHVSEKEQGEMLCSLMDDIQGENMMGALIFSWQDEWFKRTWNTMELDVESRRPYWSDYQTNEQNFGLLAFEPGEAHAAAYVDGDFSEWTENDFIAKSSDMRLSAKSDEQFLYIMLEDERLGKEPVYLPINTIDNQGNTSYNGVKLSAGADFMLELNGEENSVLLIDPYYDTNYFMYGHQLDIMPHNSAYEQKDTGEFVPIEMMLDRGYTLPDGRVIPYSLFETGKLLSGNANPASKDYNSLADFYISGTSAEIRIPWLLLNISDPSGKQVISDMYQNGAIGHEKIDSIDIGEYGSSGQNVTWGQYSWQEWEMPTYHERLKKSYPMIQSYFGEIGNNVLNQRTWQSLLWPRWSYSEVADIATWFPIEPVLNYSIAFLLSILLYFFLVLMYIHISFAMQGNRRKRDIKKISRVLRGDEELIYPRRCKCNEAGREPAHARLQKHSKADEEFQHAKQFDRYKIKGLRNPFSSRNLLIFINLLEDADDSMRNRIKDIMLKMGFERYADKNLSTHDITKLLILIRVIGMLQLQKYAGKIKALLYEHKGITDLEYQGLLTLSVLGDEQNLAGIAMDESFVKTLSFRSLQEIFKAYTGDKERLYGLLINSKDTYIKRIAIKRIGQEEYVQFADALMPFLSSGNYNVVIDAARSLGQLKADKAAPEILTLFQHEKWEVRAVAVTALASINTEDYEKEAVAALSDSEWQVRVNAALALSKYPQVDRIMRQVKESGDRFAFEAFRFVIDSNKVWEQSD